MAQRQYIQRFLKHCRTYSVFYAVTEIACVVDRKISPGLNKPYSAKLLGIKERYILDWGKKYFSEEISRYSTDTVASATGSQNDTSTSPIWIMWFQGIDQAPELVRLLIDNIRRNTSGHPIVLLDEKNYKQYCTIPLSIIQRYESGQITIQAFSDIIRVFLLRERGGLWVDSTLFITKPIPDYVFSLPVFNVKHISPDYQCYNAVADADLYQSYLIAARPHSITYSFISDCLVKYWDTHENAIDYFLIFYIAKLGREYVPAVKEEFNAIPDNNKLCEILNDYLQYGQPYSAADESHFLDNQTWAYKLTWKSAYPITSTSGKPTLYAHILNRLRTQ
jgi:hypothetical protein